MAMNLKENFPSSPQGAPRRVSDAAVMPADKMDGSVGMDGSTVNLPTVGYENPGATPDLRGVEANTGKKTDAGNSYDLPPQRSSWAEMGEQYPTASDPHTGVN